MIVGMRKISISLILIVWVMQAVAQLQTPDELWGQLFKDVQLSKLLGDNKTFVDAVPKFSRQEILQKYSQQKSSDSFNLLSFVKTNFTLPVTPSVKVKEGLSLK